MRALGNSFVIAFSSSAVVRSLSAFNQSSDPFSVLALMLLQSAFNRDRYNQNLINADGFPRPHILTSTVWTLSSRCIYHRPRRRDNLCVMVHLLAFQGVTGLELQRRFNFSLYDMQCIFVALESVHIFKVRKDHIYRIVSGVGPNKVYLTFSGLMSIINNCLSFILKPI